MEDNTLLLKWEESSRKLNYQAGLLLRQADDRL